MSAATPLREAFPDAETARGYMEAKRWPAGAICPGCTEPKRITSRKGGYYRCNACKTDFTVRTGTIFERSHIPLHKWLYAMHLLVTTEKGISSPQLSAQIDTTQKSAWFMLQRLREACGTDQPAMSGMSDALKALDTITDRVLAYRPKGKGEAAAKVAKKVERDERRLAN